MNDFTGDWIGFMWTGVFLGILGALRTDSWPVLWMCLEINLMSFIPLLNVKKMTFLYFANQCIGSLRILLGGIFDFIYFVSVGFILKIRLAPFHFWGAVLLPHLSEPPKMVFLTWQKIPLLVFVTSVSKSYLYFYFFCNIFFALSSVSRKRLSIMIFFSSFLHVRWVIRATFRLGAKYFLFYCIITGALLCSRGRNLFILLMNSAGLPPLSGFFLKLELLCGISMAVGLSLILVSVIILFAYTRVMMEQDSSSLCWTTYAVCSYGIFC